MEQEYNRLSEQYKKYVRLKGLVLDEDTEVYDCHKWVSLLPTIQNQQIFLFDEKKENLYYSKTEFLNNKFRNYFGHAWFDYVYSHSFIKVDNSIFIDLTLQSEGLTFEQVQEVCEELTKIDMYY